MSDTNDPCFPLIFSDRCDGCAKTGKPRCIEFCPNGAFAFKDGKAVVAYPVKCGDGCSTVHCSACVPLCHNKAMFSSENSRRLQSRRIKR